MAKAQNVVHTRALKKQVTNRYINEGPFHNNRLENLAKPRKRRSGPMPRQRIKHNTH